MNLHLVVRCWLGCTVGGTLIGMLVHPPFWWIGTLFGGAVASFIHEEGVLIRSCRSALRGGPYVYPWFASAQWGIVISLLFLLVTHDLRSPLLTVPLGLTVGLIRVVAQGNVANPARRKIVPLSKPH